MVKYVLLLSAREFHSELKEKIAEIFKFVGEIIESTKTDDQKGKEKKTETSEIKCNLQNRDLCREG